MPSLPAAIRIQIPVLLAVLLAGCGGGSAAPAPAGSPAGPTGAGLFKIITQDDPFDQWGQFPSALGLHASSLPHASQTETRVNAIGLGGVGGGGPLPDGAIIVKRNLGAGDGAVDALVVMWKVAGYDPANNDWFWAVLLQDGTVNAEGRLSSCTGCHRGAQANDFIYLQQL